MGAARLESPAPLGYSPRNRKEGFTVSQSTELTVFTAPGGDRLRVILREDQPWFVASDVCDALSITNVTDAVQRLDADEYDQVSPAVVSNESQTVGRGGSRRVTIVSEPGLYALIMTSRKHEARIFQRWVTHDVLPTIRRSGGYGTAVQPALPSNFAEALELAARQARELEANRKILADTEHVVERMTASSGCLSFGQAAQTLGFGRQTFIAHLGRLKLIILRPGASDHLRPYQNQIHAGRFEVEAQSYEHPEEGTQTVSRTRVTPKGLVHIAKELLNEGKLPPRGKTWFADRTSNKESR